MNDDATQFTYFKGNELTQLIDITKHDESSDKIKALKEGSIFLNKYKILKVLGEGSFSLIYLLEARDVSKKLLVAKEFFPKGYVTRNKNEEVILKTSLSQKEKENFQFMKDIFIGEAQNLVKVSKRTHPNILNFFALEENVHNTMYLITDYEEGLTLKEYVEQRKKEHKEKITNQEIIGIATGLLNALEHIHKVNVYHQDIKLENILIRQDHYPLLLDFGASIILYDKNKKKYFNAITPRYAAPEQVDLSQPPKIDQRTDIYELGVLLYKLITDEFPPKASERLKAQEEYKDSYIPLEVQKPYGYDMNLIKAVDRALELEQVNRFQNADDFKKSILHKKPSDRNLLFSGLGLLASVFFFLMYLFWPKSEGTVKLNLEQKKYFVYSDGKKIPLSQEKTILLPTGKHQLTVLKDGYMPCELNVTIKENSIANISAKLVPLRHEITLSSNISEATFKLNGKRFLSNTFEGHVGEKYSITTEAKNHLSKTTEIDYIELHKTNFKFYQELQLVETKVKIIIDMPFKIGENIIKVNDRVLDGDTFFAKHDKIYKIDIENPYYKKVHLERRYGELNKNEEEKIILKLGYGEIGLKGLPPGVTIEVYKKYLNNNKLVNSKFTYINKEYKTKILAFDQIYLKLSKEGYETFTTPVINIQRNGKYEEIVKLKKEKKMSMVEVVPSSNIKKTIEKVQIDKDINKPPIVIHRGDEHKNKNISMHLTKRVEVETTQRKQASKKVVPKPRGKQKIKTVKYRIKYGDTIFSIARKHRTTVEEVRKQNNYKQGQLLKIGKVLTTPVDTYFKKKPRAIRVRKKKREPSSKYIWYCLSGADGTQTWSAKASTKKVASSSALNKCRRKKGTLCRVSNCYILGMSYN